MAERPADRSAPQHAVGAEPGAHAVPGVCHQDTSKDEEIARALAAAEAAGAPAPPPPPDTSMDAALALQLHSDDIDRLCGHAPPDVTTASHLDGLVRKALRGARFTKMAPQLSANFAPGAAATPSRERERDRLLQRLAVYGLREKEVQGDGNCQFAAVSDQLFRTPAHHAAVRGRVCRELAAHPERYRSYVAGSYPSYVAGMARLGTWGDHVTLQAAANAWGIRMFIITSFLDNCVIAIDPVIEDPAFSSRALYLSFFAEVHYNSIYPAVERAFTPGALLGAALGALDTAVNWMRPGPPTV